MIITYFGHSALQIKTGETTLLIDPFITGNKLSEGIVSPEVLNPDAILMTHAHGDHWGDAPSILKRTGALLVADFEITTYAERELGHSNVHPMNIGGSWDFEWGEVIRTYARHSSSFPDGTYGGLAGGFVLHLEDKCIYIAGDTCAFVEMEWIGEDHDIDVAFLPIGDNLTMGPEEAAQCVEMLEPALTVPVHYDTFPYIEIDMNRFNDAMDEAGCQARVMAPGETLEV